jgi:hypothetical protein
MIIQGNNLNINEIMQKLFGGQTKVSQDLSKLNLLPTYIDFDKLNALKFVTVTELREKWDVVEIDVIAEKYSGRFSINGFAKDELSALIDVLENGQTTDERVFDIQKSILDLDFTQTFLRMNNVWEEFSAKWNELQMEELKNDLDEKQDNQEQETESEQDQEEQEQQDQDGDQEGDQSREEEQDTDGDGQDDKGEKGEDEGDKTDNGSDSDNGEESEEENALKDWVKENFPELFDNKEPSGQSEYGEGDDLEKFMEQVEKGNVEGDFTDDEEREKAKEFIESEGGDGDDDYDDGKQKKKPPKIEDIEINATQLIGALLGGLDEGEVKRRFPNKRSVNNIISSLTRDEIEVGKMLMKLEDISVPQAKEILRKNLVEELEL